MSHTTENLLLTPSKLLSPMKRLMRQSRSSPYKVEKRTPRKGSRKQLLAEESNLKNGILESKIDDVNEFEPLDDKLEKSCITPISTPKKSRRALVNEILKSKEKPAKENMVEPSTDKTKMLFSVDSNLEDKSKIAEYNKLEQITGYATPKKSRRDLVNEILKSKEKLSKENRIYKEETKSLEKMDTTCFNLSIPNELIGREDEIKTITDFIKKCTSTVRSSSLYISGAPGTGKSACVKTICKNYQIKESLEEVIHLNCMASSSPLELYKQLAMSLGAKSSINKLSCQKFIEKNITFSTDHDKMILVVLDEMDQLNSNDFEVLYKLFDLVSVKNSKLIMIGIANSLDLTDRMLPRLQTNAKLKSKLELLNFKPYSQSQLVKIIESRLPKGTNQFSSIDKMSIQLAARKISSSSGDVRKLLNTVQRTIELNGGVKVNPIQMNKYMTSSQQNNKQYIELPMQQKLVICTLYNICKKQKTKEVLCSKLYEMFKCVSCKQNGSCLGQSDFFNICQSLSDRRVLDIKNAKKHISINRQSKVKFATTESEIIEIYFKGNSYFEKVLNDFF